MNTIVLDNNMQGFLVKQALQDKIKKNKALGFSESDPEIKELKRVIPKI